MKTKNIALPNAQVKKHFSQVYFWNMPWKRIQFRKIYRNYGSFGCYRN